MKPIDISGPNGVPSRLAAAPVSGAEPAGRVREDAAETEAPTLSLASAGGSPPVDADRVAEIRKAIEDGRYPVLPVRVADAMIAAGLLLRTQ